MYGQPNESLVGLALLVIAGFVLWLVLFTGDGYKGIAQDLKSIGRKKPEKFPVPVFDRSKIELPRPKKPKVQDPVREPINFNEQQLRDWADQLQQSIKEIRKEASELAKAYNAMPPSLIEDPSKPKRKPAAKKTTKKVAVKKTAKKPAAKKAATAKPKKKPAAKKKGR